MYLTHTLPWPHHFQCTSDTSGNHCSLSAYFCAIIIGAQALHRAPYGQGTGPIHLDNLYCNSSESRLVDCRHNGISVHNCAHNEDAGLRCQGMYIHMCQKYSHRRLQSCVGTRARLGYAAFDAQLRKVYLVTSLYAKCTSVHAYAICW